MGFSFDPTFTMGNVLMAILTIAGIIAGYAKLREQVASQNKAAKEDRETTRRELARFEGTLESMQSNCAQCHFTEYKAGQEVKDRNIERRLEALERITPSVYGMVEQLKGIDFWMKRLDRKIDKNDGDDTTSFHAKPGTRVF